VKLDDNPLATARAWFRCWTAIDELDLSRTGLGDAGACALSMRACGR